MRQLLQQYGLGLLLWVGIYFYPTYNMILMIGFFIIADTILGILAAKKKGTLEHKVSKKYRPALDKFVGYGVVIFVAHVMEKEFVSTFPAMKIITGYLVFIELKSIDENFHTLSGISIFKALSDKLKLK